MIKKITATLLCLIMLLSVTGYAASFTDVPEDGSELSEAVGVLSELGIISGMGDGSFSPYTSLTRAQVAKMAVCIMGKTKEAVATTDAFSDVKSTDWYSGYVNVVAKEGIITGYPDGSFGANDYLTYAQAITIAVRLLGYDASDVGHRWPQGYLDKAEVLSLTEGMSFSNNDIINREQATVLFYRTLFTDMKDAKAKLVTKMDKNVYEDTVVLATNKENASLLSNEVQTDAGVFTFDENAVDMTREVGKEGTVVVNDKNAVIAFVENDGFETESYTVSAVYRESNSDNVSLVTDSGKTIKISKKATAYVSGSSTVAENLAESLNTGSTVTLFKENGALKYVFVDEYKNQGPVTVLDTNMVTGLFDVDNIGSVKVIRKGISATLEDIEMYDVLYYSEKTNTIYAYCDRVTGLYEDAYPMKANVSRVTVSGKEYNLSSLSAVNKLNESKGAFEIGDRVTLLFGEDGEVVDAVSLTYADFSMYGVITGSGREVSSDKDTEGRTEYYVTVLHADGNSVKYTVEDDTYFDRAGDLCCVDFENSFAVLTFPKESTVTGFVNADMKFIGTQKLSDEVKILDYVYGTETEANVVAVKLSDIDSLQLAKKDVKCVVYNKKGEIEVLYLDDVTGNGNIYGVLVGKEINESAGGSKSGVYTILSGNNEYKVSGVYYPALNKGDCVEYVKEATSTSIIEMTQIASGSKIESIEDNIITLGGLQYTLSDDAVIYMGETSGEMRTVTRADASGISGKIALFSDRTIYTGGKVRVVRIYTE